MFENEVREYTVRNGDMEFSFLNLGAVTTSIKYKGHELALRFDEYDGYFGNMSSLGGIIGRTAGRIRDGKLKNWQLPLNQDGKHNLHGSGQHFEFYGVDIHENVIELKRYDKEGKFPGNANIFIRFTVETNRIIQEFICNSDTPTVFNMTNHTYFNLNGGGTILDHELLIESNSIWNLDNDLLPVEERNVEGTAFDFNQPKAIRKALNQGDEQFKYSKFIDHPFKLNGDIKLSNGKIEMCIETNQNYLVVYGGNYLGDEQHKLRGNNNIDYNGICLETQEKPNTTDLTTDYYARTEYNFSTIK